MSLRDGYGMPPDPRTEDTAPRSDAYRLGRMQGSVDVALMLLGQPHPDVAGAIRVLRGGLEER